jgi:hypothetical protein
MSSGANLRFEYRIPVHDTRKGRSRFPILVLPDPEIWHYWQLRPPSRADSLGGPHI